MNNDLTSNMTPTVAPDHYDKDLPKGGKTTHNTEVRKRIEELLERKRLKALLDDADDWDID